MSREQWKLEGRKRILGGWWYVWTLKDDEDVVVNVWACRVEHLVGDVVRL